MAAASSPIPPVSSVVESSSSAASSLLELAQSRRHQTGKAAANDDFQPEILMEVFVSSPKPPLHPCKESQFKVPDIPRKRLQETRERLKHLEAERANSREVSRRKKKREGGRGGYSRWLSLSDAGERAARRAGFLPRPLPARLPFAFEEHEDDEEDSSFHDHRPPARLPQSLVAELEALEAEERAVLEGTHPDLLDLREQLAQQRADHYERIEHMIKHERDQIRRTFGAEREAIEKERADKKRELRATMLAELEEKLRKVDGEVAAMDLNGPLGPTPTMNKKSLRRRGNEPATSSDKKKAKQALPQINYLLADAEIAHDLRCVGHVEVTPTKNQHLHKVSLDNQRLVYEGKSYTRGQNLFITTAAYSQFAAVVQTVCEQFVHFKSTMAGDTRAVMATLEDLESGRVVVSRRLHGDH